MSIHVLAFGQGRYEFDMPGPTATVGEALDAHGIESQGRRVAVNGNPVGLGTGVLEGDEVTVVPRVQGG